MIFEQKQKKPKNLRVTRYRGRAGMAPVNRKYHTTLYTVVGWHVRRTMSRKKDPKTNLQPKNDRQHNGITRAATATTLQQ